MSDLSTGQFVISTNTGTVAAGTQYYTVPVDADLVAVTVGVNAAGTAGNTTVNVTVNGTQVLTGATASGDAGASINGSNYLQIAGDSASKVGKAKATSSVKSGMTNQITNNVTSGIDFWSPVAPADTVLASLKAGDEVGVTVVAVATGVTRANAALHFVRK